MTIETPSDLEKVIVESSRQADERLARVDERLERAATLLIQSIEQDNQRARERDRWLDNMFTLVSTSMASRPTAPLAESVERPAPRPSPVEVDEAASAVAEPHEEAAEEEESDTFQMVVTIMIAIVGLVAAVVAWRSTLVGGDDIATLHATINAETTTFINTADLHRHYRAYSTYTLNETLQQQLQSSEVTKTAKTTLVNPEVTSDLVAVNELFFPTRYLNRDGSYNTERELGEAWAKAEQLRDLDPTIYMEESNQGRAQGLLFVVSFLPIAISLLFYTLAEVLHPSRNVLRYACAGGGTLFLIVSVVGVIMLEASI